MPHADLPADSNMVVRGSTARALFAAVLTLAASAHAQEVCVTTPVSIPDGQRSAAIPLEVAARAGGRQALTHIRVAITITHPWVGDLHVVLRHPTGVEVVLLDRPGLPSASNFPGPWGCGGDDVAAVFDDGFLAESETACEVAGTAITGEFRPAQSLAALNGLAPAGVWTVVVTDLIPVDAGTVASVCLQLESEIVATCAGDLDGDGAVGGADLALLLGAWGTSCTGCPEDLDGDGTIGGADLAIVLGAWGTCAG